MYLVSPIIASKLLTENTVPAKFDVKQIKSLGFTAVQMHKKMNRIGHRWPHCAAALCHGNEKLHSAMMETMMNILVNQIPPAPKPSLMDTFFIIHTDGWGLDLDMATQVICRSIGPKAAKDKV